MKVKAKHHIPNVTNQGELLKNIAPIKISGIEILAPKLTTGTYADLNFKGAYPSLS